MVEHDSDKLSISRQAELLSLNRASLYYTPVGVSDEEIRLQRRIDEMYTDRPVSGSRYITAILRREGWTINRKRVVRCMREMGIAGVSPGPNLSKRNLAHKIYPYLLRGVKAITGIMSFPSTSPTSASSVDGCTWSPSLTGILAIS